MKRPLARVIAHYHPYSQAKIGVVNTVLVVKNFLGFSLCDLNPVKMIVCTPLKRWFSSRGKGGGSATSSGHGIYICWFGLLSKSGSGEPAISRSRIEWGFVVTGQPIIRGGFILCSLLMVMYVLLRIHVDHQHWNRHMYTAHKELSNLQKTDP